MGSTATTPVSMRQNLRWPVLYCLILSLLALAIFMSAKQQVLPGLDGPLTFDGNYYSLIYTQGYQFSGDIEEKRNIAFLPLNAGLIGATDLLMPGNNLFLKVALFGTLTLFGTLLGVYFVGRDSVGPQAAVIAPALWAFSPVALYNFVGYTEPVYALLTAWILLAVHRQRFWLAAIMAGIALLGRPQAIVLVGFVGVMLFHQAGWRIGRLLENNGGWKAALALAPLMTYSTWLVIRHDDALVYVHALEAWRRGSVMDGHLNPVERIGFLFDSISGDQPHIIQWTVMLGTLALGLVSICFGLSLAVGRTVRWLYWAMLAFWFAAVSFDVMNAARHLFFMLPWAVILGGALAHTKGPLAGKIILMLPWLAIATVINFHAVMRYYQGLWVS